MDKIDFNALLADRLLDGEWEYIWNNGDIGRAPRSEWERMLREKEASEPQERIESFIRGFNNYAISLKSGEAFRVPLYSAEEIEHDSSLGGTTLFVRLQSEKSPLILIAPGGSYEFCSVKNEGFPVWDVCFERGYSCAILVYRTAPFADGLRPVADMARAFSLIRQNADKWNIDTERICLFGSSAAGHLAAYYTATERVMLPQSVVLCYPVITFGSATHEKSRRAFCGGEPTAKQIADYSVENLITPRFPPCFIWHCSADESVPLENSFVLDKALSEQGVRHELHVFEGGRHGLGAAAGSKFAVWLDRAFAFIESL